MEKFEALVSEFFYFRVSFSEVSVSLSQGEKILFLDIRRLSKSISFEIISIFTPHQPIFICL